MNDKIIAWATRRPPDFVIDGADRPYLLRWFLVPRNPIFNIYLHCFLRSDDDRALHDHPWVNCSWLLKGQYVEHTIAAGGIHHRALRKSGSFVVRTPWRAHRIELVDAQPAWSLFVTGPRIRAWGFHCPDQGWVHWKRFTSPPIPVRSDQGVLNELAMSSVLTTRQLVMALAPALGLPTERMVAFNITTDPQGPVEIKVTYHLPSEAVGDLLDVVRRYRCVEVP